MKKIILNKYKVIEENDSGSFSTVYKVMDDNNQLFAIKKVSIPLSDKKKEKIIKEKNINEDINDYLVRIIENEKIIYNKLKNSKQLLSFKEFVQDNNDYYFIMDYVEDIKTYYDKNVITTRDIILLSIDICDSLIELEKNNMIHGDIKPSNIFISDNSYLLGDFSSVTKNGQKVLFSTKNFMAPEIYEKKNVSYSSDIYSLGIVMYLLLSGDLPFVDGSINEDDAFKIRMKGELIPDIFGVDQKLMKIIKKCCSYSVNDRYSSASILKDELCKLGNFNKNIINNAENTKGKDNKIDNKVDNNLFIEIKDENKNINLKDEPTISIYDEKLVSESKKYKANISNSNVIKNAFSKKNMKKYILILFIILIPTFAFIHYSQNKTCKVGYINRGGVCIKGSYYCPNDYSLNSDNKCQKVLDSKPAKVTYTCKSGYNLMGEMCVNNDVKEVEFTYKCLDGFILNGKKCEKTESSDAVITYTCPSGYVSAGDQCVTVSNVPGTKVYKCPDSSYTMSGTKCKKTINKTSSPSQKYYCDSGGTLNGTVCDYAVSPSYGWIGAGCSKGTINYRDMKCHYTETAKITYTCENGTLNSSGICVYTETDTRDATIGYTCPSGYVSVGSECAKTSGVAGKKKYNCLDGAKLKNNKCYITISTDAVSMYACPDGYIASGAQCLREDILTPVKKYSCSRVYKLNGGNCEKYDIISPKVKYD